jgi:hypothetical protein
MEDLFTRAEHFLEKEQEINKEAELKIAQMHEKSFKIPSLD